MSVRSAVDPTRKHRCVHRENLHRLHDRFLPQLMPSSLFTFGSATASAFSSSSAATEPVCTPATTATIAENPAALFTELSRGDSRGEVDRWPGYWLATCLLFKRFLR